jgi:4-hydroxy-tetrahydrodipicolinate synthase
MIDILNNWNSDNTEIPAFHYDTLCHFDYQNQTELDYAFTYREREVPFIVYNIPGRSGKNLETDTLMRLAAHPRIVGVKEASGDLGQIMDVLQRRPKGFSVLSGDDNLAYTLLALGGDGVISVASHLIPEALVELCHKGLSGDLAGARALHFRYLTLMKSMFLDTNPIPVKTALAFQGRLQEVFRLPMCPMDEAKRQQLRKVMQDTGLL